nr:hypothetical protein [Gammaproteobacteria bacterium]
MPRIKEVLTTLEQLVSLKQATTNKINELNPDNFIDTEMYQAVLKQLRKEESAWRERMVETLRQYDRFPERHADSSLRSCFNTAWYISVSMKLSGFSSLILL